MQPRAARNRGRSWGGTDWLCSQALPGAPQPLLPGQSVVFKDGRGARPHSAHRLRTKEDMMDFDDLQDLFAFAVLVSSLTALIAVLVTL